MAEKMTLAAHAKWLRQAAEEICKEGHAGWGNTCERAADAIDAHLAQPAQEVDVGAIREVIDELDDYCEASDDSCYGTLSTKLVRFYTETLTRAIGNPQTERTMKVKVTMKDPDAMLDAVREAVERDVQAMGLPDDEAESLIEMRAEKEQGKLGKWFRHSEYLAVEFDTDAMTATVLDA